MSDPPLDEAQLEAKERSLLWQLSGCLGCAGLIALFIILMWLAARAADQRVMTDKARVELALQEILPCEIPAGYRGFRGHEGPPRIALLAPTSYGGKTIPVDQPLVISVWSFQPGTSLQARRKQLLDYWGTKIQESLNGKPQPVSAAHPLQVRGSSRPGESFVYSDDSGRSVRLVLGLIPRTKGSGETVALTFVGASERFDRKAMDTLLGSIQ